MTRVNAVSAILLSSVFLASCSSEEGESASKARARSGSPREVSTDPLQVVLETCTVQRGWTFESGPRPITENVEQRTESLKRILKETFRQTGSHDGQTLAEGTRLGQLPVAVEKIAPQFPGFAFAMNVQCALGFEQILDRLGNRNSAATASVRTAGTDSNETWTTNGWCQFIIKERHVVAIRVNCDGFVPSSSSSP